MAEDTEAAERERPESAKPWHDRLKEYRERVSDRWDKQCDNLDKLYSRDERADSADREYSIFWANIEVLEPAVYARPPVPVVAPRFKQPNPVASAASDVLERTLVTTIEQHDLDGCLQEVTSEFLRYARGTGWARLSTKPDGYECVEFDHVTREDFAHDPARTWREVGWVGRRAWLTREKLKERFGGETQHLAKYGKTIEDIPLKKRDENAAAHNPEDQAPVWELWDKKKQRVCWVAEDFDCYLDIQPPPLNLSGFWPCPKPAYGTLVPKKLRPVPDIRHYKDQIEEINEYTARIAGISERLRLQGFYPAGAPELSDAIEAAFKRTDQNAILVPISSFAALGGSKMSDQIVWIPFREAIELLKGLVELRRVLIDDVYQITGISDILRGQTEASETATAQQIKSQWGSIRIRKRQNEIIRFARDMTRIAGEIIAENFQPATIQQMAQVNLPSMQDKQKAQAQMQQAQAVAQQTGQPAPPPPPDLVQTLKTPSFEEVMKFLRDDRARGFVIEIETDSTIQPDEDAEKQRRIEFVQSVGGLFQQAAPVVMQAPQLGPFMGEVLKFAAQGFRAGRPLEGAIEQMTQMLSQMAQQAMQPQGPTPEQQLAQQEAQNKARESDAKLKGIEAQTQAKVVGAEADIAQTRLDMVASAQEHQQNMQRLTAEAAMPPKPPGRPN